MILQLLSALLPPALLLFFIWWKDPHQEPTKQLLKAILYGMLICVPVVIAELVVKIFFMSWVANNYTTNFNNILYAFCGPALMEEGFKLLALWLVLRKNKYFDEHFDGIVYAVFVGMGFAAVENVAYVISSGDSWISTAIGRSLMSVPGHYAYAILMGYYYSIYHFVNHSNKNAVLILLAPILLHGIYDSIAMFEWDNDITYAIGFILLIGLCIIMQRVAYKKVVVQIKRDRKEQTPKEA